MANNENGKNYTAIPYLYPQRWAYYQEKIINLILANTKAAVIALKTTPYQKAWVEELQQVQLKREIAGTSKIEGADFTEGELDAVLEKSGEDLHTRAQKQAYAAMQAYKWISGVPDDRPIDMGFICELHAIIVTGADDDHCQPGVLRGKDLNVVFGMPRHRGASGGEECHRALNDLIRAMKEEFRGCDPLIQALIVHYHFAAMHPFADGNGRTARALEALLLQRAGLREACFIPMSNYYYDEKRAYLDALAKVRDSNHDLTPFLVFGLRGIELQCSRLLGEIQTFIQKAIFRNLMFDLFHRLKTPKRRVIVDRQLEILKLLLRAPRPLTKLSQETSQSYKSVKFPWRALIRDLNDLIKLGAIKARKVKDQEDEFSIEINLKWPMEITETDFFRRIKELPKAKTHAILQV